MTFDLNDWYAGLKSGRYRFFLTFGTDSGLGPATTGDAFFAIGGPDARPDWAGISRRNRPEEAWEDRGWSSRDGRG